MAFMMPVVKNNWDIYNTRRSRHSSEPGDMAPGRARKVSESRSEGPAVSGAARAALSPHRSAPTMRSLSYSRAAPAGRSSPRVHAPAAATAAAAAAAAASPRDKLHTRARAVSPPAARAFIGCVPCF